MCIRDRSYLSAPRILQEEPQEPVRTRMAQPVEPVTEPTPAVHTPAPVSYTHLHEDGTIESVTPTHGAPALVQKRIVKDLDTMYYPESFVVPSTDIVFDRAMICLLYTSRCV